MTEIKIPPGEIPLLVQDAGLVTGLLRSSAPDLYFELDWFANAVAEIEAIPSRRGPLLKLLRDLLGKSAKDTPADRAWYTFPVAGAPSYVYVVLPLDDTTGPASTIGIGIQHGFTSGPFSLRASLYVPLFEVPLASPVVVTGSGAHPIELALDVPFGQTVTAGG
ncbi:MAG TPA: hypothetical protein VLK84_19745, partial [Longimicrobium sp.]|nr:hypothetical protein [Longimicrobium sp.]